MSLGRSTVGTSTSIWGGLTLTRSPRHPVGHVVGDLLVRPRSAYGRDRRGRELFPDADLLHVGRTDHWGLLNHPDVLASLRTWLS